MSSFVFVRSTLISQQVRISFTWAGIVRRSSSRCNLTAESVRDLCTGRRGEFQTTSKPALRSPFCKLGFSALQEQRPGTRHSQGVALSQRSRIQEIDRRHLHAGTVNMKHAQTAPKGFNHAVVAFGSNMGNRIANIEDALSRMGERGLQVLKLSSLYETMPMYYDDQDSFLNGVCQIETDLEPLPLLDVLQSIEDDLGRKRIIDKGPRTIDLDIVLYNDDCIKNSRLNVPHILMLEREFVLRPLAE